MSSINNNYPIETSQDIGRYSTDAVRQLGARRKVITANGARKNYFESRTGNEHYYSPDNVILNENIVRYESYPEMKFFLVKGHFLKRGIPEKTATSMAMLIFDVARMDKLDPLSLLNNLSSGKVSLSNETFLSLNVLRPVDSQHQTVSDINNRKSLKSKLIRA